MRANGFSSRETERKEKDQIHGRCWTIESHVFSDGDEVVRYNGRVHLRDVVAPRFKTGAEASTVQAKRQCVRVPSGATPGYTALSASALLPFDSHGKVSCQIAHVSDRRVYELCAPFSNRGCHIPVLACFERESNFF